MTYRHSKPKSKCGKKRIKCCKWDKMEKDKCGRGHRHKDRCEIVEPPIPPEPTPLTTTFEPSTTLALVLCTTALGLRNLASKLSPKHQKKH